MTHLQIDVSQFPIAMYIIIVLSSQNIYVSII